MKKVLINKIEGADVPFIIGIVIFLGYIYLSALWSISLPENQGIYGEQLMLRFIIQGFVALSSLVFLSCSSYFRIREIKEIQPRNKYLAILEILAPAILCFVFYARYGE